MEILGRQFILWLQEVMMIPPLKKLTKAEGHKVVKAIIFRRP